ncbi:transcriptional adapter 1-like [Culicoides brevitarsis]|uniref:transcriptional adapter 1-like n=1 Tax=Culicoides brevitarsis TaxID=469753 RepID=UPI00307B2B78
MAQPHEKDKVLVAKQALMASLGDELWARYLNNMKAWFRQKCTKNEFDMACRKLFVSPNQARFHNQFLLAILNKIDILEPVKVKTDFDEASSPFSMQTKGNHHHHLTKKRKRLSENATFEPSPVFDYLPCESFVDHTPVNATPPILRYVAQEMFLPDSGLIMGRLMVASWEAGLTSVDETAVDLIVTGVQFLLKNILTSVITKKKHFRATADTKFMYDIGAPLKDPFTRNTVTRQKVDDEPIELDKEISSFSLQRRPVGDSLFLSACEEPNPVPRRRITTLDLYKALQDKNVIPSHAVYSINIEKISSMLT